MAVIIIGGVPGVGKTTIAYQLAALFGVEQVIQTDVLKSIMQLLNYNELSYTPSHQAWRYLGEKNFKNIIVGFEKHTNYFKGWMLGMIKLAEEKGRHLIIEGVQATPSFFQSIPIKEKVGFFFTLSDREEHERRFLLKNAKRTITNNGWVDNFDVIRLIDSYMLSQARIVKENFYIIENKNMEATLKQMTLLCSNLNPTRKTAEAITNAKRL